MPENVKRAAKMAETIGFTSYGERAFSTSNNNIFSADFEATQNL